MNIRLSVMSGYVKIARRFWASSSRGVGPLPRSDVSAAASASSADVAPF